MHNDLAAIFDELVNAYGFTLRPILTGTEIAAYICDADDTVCLVTLGSSPASVSNWLHYYALGKKVALARSTW